MNMKILRSFHFLSTVQGGPLLVLNGVMTPINDRVITQLITSRGPPCIFFFVFSFFRVPSLGFQLSIGICSREYYLESL